MDRIGQSCVVNSGFFLRFLMGLSLFRGWNSGKSTCSKGIVSGLDGVSFIPGLSIPEFVDGNNYKFLFGGIGRLVKSLDDGISSDLWFSDRLNNGGVTLFQGLVGISHGGYYFHMFG